MEGKHKRRDNLVDTKIRNLASVRFMVKGALKKGTRGEENKSGERRVDRRTEIHALFSNVF